MEPDPDALAAAALAGRRNALARLLTRVENADPESLRTLRRLPVRRRETPGTPHVIGVTGPPGAGKSTFTDRLVAHARGQGERVAVVAVDPSSPLSGGAILGDRIRMDRHVDDPGVYVRSLSSRGHLGGLSRATGNVVDLLDACGYDRIVVETVGVGQGELAILNLADTVLVVLTPESGDTVQAMKAGLLEIADVFCVNKADRPGADLLRRELELGVHLDQRPWAAPVHVAVALRDEGVDAVVSSLEAHRAWCGGDGRAGWEARRADGRVAAWLDRVAEEARRAAWRAAEGSARLEALRRGTLAPEDM